jgi:hypothetical protein
VQMTVIVLGLEPKVRFAPYSRPPFLTFPPFNVMPPKTVSNNWREHNADEIGPWNGSNAYSFC